MAERKMLAEVLQDYCNGRKNGALFIAVKEKSENLVRIFFQDGEIRHMSYGTCSGKDCLGIMDCYEFTTAYFVNDMKAPAISTDLPPTTVIVDQLRRGYQAVMMQ